MNKLSDGERFSGRPEIVELARSRHRRDLGTDKSGDCIRPNPNGDWPQIDSEAYIDPRAVVIGNVHIAADVYVGPNAIIRADEIDDNGKVHPVRIASECNVQDGVIIHSLAGTEVTIGRRTSLAHGCVVHGPCSIGRACFVGFNAVVYNAILGDGVFVSTGAVVQGVELKPNALVPPCGTVLCDDDIAKVLREAGRAECEFAERVANTNIDLARTYNRLFAPDLWR